MGRSQVLYNRTKGRNRHRSGRGVPSDRSKFDSNPGKSSHHRENNDDGWKQQQREQRSGKIRTTYGTKTEKDYEDEYQVLLAGRDTYLNNRVGDDEEEENLLGSTASICIPSFAATLDTLSISKRLRMPLHVAALAFPSRHPEIEESKEDENHLPSKELENWLDDACAFDQGSDNNDEQQTITNNENAGIMADALPSSISRGHETRRDDGKSEDAEAIPEDANDEEDEENLDDWLDSIIE